MDRTRFPTHPWQLTESFFDPEDHGTTETLFAVGNGYIGMRGNLEEGRDFHTHGTYVNGFHETWPIRHAEEAFGFAEVGQTVVNIPDPKVLRLYVDDEPLLLSVADLVTYDRTLDLRDGVLYRDIVWRTPSGNRVRVRSRRMVSFRQRHLALMTFEVTVLDREVPVVVSSQLINRQDGLDEYRTQAGSADSADPRRATQFDHRVLEPEMHWGDDCRTVLAYRCTNSGMTLGVATDHQVETENRVELLTQVEQDYAKHVYRVSAQPGVPVLITKAVSYHTSRSVPAKELVNRCRRTLDRVREEGVEPQFLDQRVWLDEYWERSDVVVEGQPELQQAIRWNLFQIAQASARAEGNGIAAKGLTGSGYSGHYFWDTEVYVVPYLVYTSPVAARNAVRFRSTMLPAARRRARQLNEDGALFPWRTINGEEASAYYAAGTAQYHIDADVAYALSKYVQVTGDEEFLAREGVDVLVETARMWVDLGFWRGNGRDSFHIYGVTGPDEYTTVVNDNLFTNVMARFNLRRAAEAVRSLATTAPQDHERMVARLGLGAHEVDEWVRAADAMAIPFDAHLGIHPQDSQFHEREVWDLANTPADKRPLLLHYHPLVIYRFQVLKQADVVLALFLQGEHFTLAEKTADFEYYDPITTGDSSLSAVVQSIVAAEVGYHELALRYFQDALFVDLADLHHNASDGVHVASAAGTWAALVNGFGGMRHHGEVLTFDPRLPAGWTGLTFRVTVRGSRLRVMVRQDRMELALETGEPLDVVVRGARVGVGDDPVVVPLAGQGPRTPGAPDASAVRGSLRADGTLITASIPHLPLPAPEASDERWEADRVESR
ncbi:kojibiose phosphorylase [Actinotalea ferrariae CF5-4]|uniref:Kojibiose phosphorylase n=1 Tax=Actinotalea ferrariae CF5-4 TaxID=948458 RepID=A0A021VN16_9CELL|nr:glycosyl hydrolase family 65 protein [Actinotalea ferrariae]EYR62498.1 kojibiose phosphorylase [Actinotalea ferrariae CF5-4]